MGLLAFMRMDVNQNPDISAPAATVSISQPGAAPPELEIQITRRVEAAVRGINGVNEINSTIREGSSSTFVSFEIGTPVDRAVSDVRDAIARIRGDLPDGILEPQVERVDFDRRADRLFLGRKHLDDGRAVELVHRRHAQPPPDGHRGRFGRQPHRRRQPRDPGRARSGADAGAGRHRLARSTCSCARSTSTRPAAAPRSPAPSSRCASSAARSPPTRSAKPRSRWAAAGRSGSIRVATVRDQWAEQTSYGIQNGRQVVSFMIQKAKGYSDVTVYHARPARAGGARAATIPRVSYNLLFTPVKYIEMQYESSMRALVEGAVLAVIVVFLFLRDWRATLISAIAIPLSAIPAFWFMDLMGFTLNMVTLLSLSLVAGVLVDDAIVEIENIVRHMRMGKSAYQASIDAADEIGLPVVATTFSIVAVFLPVSMMSGIIGQFFISFGLTIVITVLISLAVARMITPMIAAYFLKAKGQAKHGEGWLMDRYLGRAALDAAQPLEIGGDRLRLLRPADRRASCMLPMTFQPNTDEDTVQVSVEMPPGVTLEQTARRRRPRRRRDAQRSRTSPPSSNRSAPATRPSLSR